MFHIDRRKIKRETRRTNSKTAPGISNAIIEPQWKQEMWNIMDKAQQLSAHDLGHWIIFHDRWIQNLHGPENRTRYNYGDIVMVDLGATNFKYEPQYEHPCVVLASDYSSILVLPGSTKKYGKGFSDIIDVPAGNGFSYDTGLQMNSIRWIHKNRVTESKGTVTNPHILKEIDEYIIWQFPTYRDRVHAEAILEDKARTLEIQNLDRDHAEAILEDKARTLEIEINRLHEFYYDILSKVHQRDAAEHQTLIEQAQIAGIDTNKMLKSS
ncbi:type II toxin-antitoxin system PemK/MazF family toxin [Paenibacillus sp. An7]|uniref:type II toxin-antitoxin system PemK/MazF family toxin n=1 Tax=Paenibacillus sp. An7 TaxID=2689577 RepID=UPI00135BD8AE|nr:type II toxin-antitoxin system PemK/MazF family toxin [Paenibacillus sp. An7]